MKILHLVSDHQVIERALDLYERVFPGSNDVIIFTSDKELHHIKIHSNSPIVNITTCKRFAESYDFSMIDYIIAHYMSFDKIDFIKSVPSHIPVGWEIYGGDLYNQFLIRRGFKLYYSDSYQYDNKAFIRFLITAFPSAYYLYKKLRYKDKYVFDSEVNKQFEYITSRVSFLGICCESDKEVLEAYSGKVFDSYEVFNFSLKQTLGQLYESVFSNGNNVLVGNSASLSNNHLYALKYLRGLIPDWSMKVVIPLSYGGNSRYIKRIKNDYSEVFRQNVSFIDGYLPLSDYNRLFLSLSTIVMTSWRQESWGNILMGLYLGLKIYMSDKNSFYWWLVSIGFIIFPLEKATPSSFVEALSVKDKVHNRELVIARYNEETVAKNLKNQFK